jgi:hypothetical protein
MLDRFLGKNIVIVLSISHPAQDEDGNVGDMPMVCEGIMYEHDENYILIGNEQQTAFSLLNHDSIVKIDLIDEADLVMLDPDRPDIDSMN